MVNQEVGEKLRWVGKLSVFCRERNGYGFLNEDGRDRRRRFEMVSKRGKGV